MNRKIIFLILALAVICGLTFFWRSAPSSFLPEAERSQLTVVDGRYCLIGHTNPFTGGILERYNAGSLKSRSMASNGLLHGLSEGWHTNGQLQVREHFRHGISSGLRTKWYDNGQKLSEVTIRNDKLHGTFRRWHPNGAPAEQIELAAGEPHGLSLAFYESGFLKAEAWLEHGQLRRRSAWREGEKKAQFIR